MTTSEKAIIQHDVQQGFFQKLKNATWEDMITLPIFTPIIIMINSLFQQWQAGTLSFDQLLMGSAMIIGLVLLILIPLFAFKLHRLDKQDIKTMRQKRFDLEVKRRETDIRMAEVRALAEIETFKMTTDRRLELLTSSAKEMDARTTLKTAIALGIIAKQSTEALNIYADLDSSTEVLNKIAAIEDQMEAIKVTAFEEAENAVKNYHENLTGGMPLDVDYNANNVDCPVPPAAEITMEGSPKFDESEKQLEEELNQPAKELKKPLP